MPLVGVWLLKSRNALKATPRPAAASLSPGRGCQRVPGLSSPLPHTHACAHARHTHPRTHCLHPHSHMPAHVSSHTQEGSFPAVLQCPHPSGSPGLGWHLGPEAAAAPPGVQAPAKRLWEPGWRTGGGSHCRPPARMTGARCRVGSPSHRQARALALAGQGFRNSGPAPADGWGSWCVPWAGVRQGRAGAPISTLPS